MYINKNFICWAQCVEMMKARDGGFIYTANNCVMAYHDDDNECLIVSMSNGDKLYLSGIEKDDWKQYLGIE